jgi:predicted nucleic acid-binding protein
LHCPGRALAAPDLLIAERANILWEKVRRNELSEREAAFAAGLLARADIELVAMRPYLETAVRPRAGLGRRCDMAG